MYADKIDNNSFSCVGISAFFVIMGRVSFNSKCKLVLDDLKVGFKGKVLEKIDVREDLFVHLKISRLNQADTVVFFGKTDSVSIGDTLVKYPNSPFCTLVKKDSSRLNFVYTFIKREDIECVELKDYLVKNKQIDWAKAIVD